MRTSLFLVGGAVVALLILSPPASYAAHLASLNDAVAPNNGPGVRIAPSRIDVALRPDSADVKVPVTVSNPTNHTETITLGLSDFTVQANAYQLLPLAGTPYTLQGLVKMDKPRVELKAGAEQTVFLVVKGQADRLRAGLLLAVPTNVETASGPGMFLRPQPSVAVPLTVAPVDAQGRLTSSLRAAPGGLHLPRIVEAGPLQVGATVRNAGDTFGRSQTTFRFSTPFAPRPFLVRQSAPAPVMPGSKAENQTSTLLTSRDSTSDTLPPIGLVRVQAESQIQLLDASSARVVQDAWLLVLPWPPFAILGGLLLIALSVRLWRTRG